MVAFWMTSKGSLGNNDGDGNENGKKSNKFIFIIVKQQLCTCITLFLHIFLPSLQHCDMKLPYITRPLYGVGEHNTAQKFLFLFLNSEVQDRYADLNTIISDFKNISPRLSK